MLSRGTKQAKKQAKNMAMMNLKGERQEARGKLLCKEKQLKSDAQKKSDLSQRWAERVGRKETKI